MSATHSTTDPAHSDRTQFLEVYPECSRLIAEIGREFIKTWGNEEAGIYQKVLIERLVDQGCEKQKAELAWNLLMQGRAQGQEDDLFVPRSDIERDRNLATTFVSCDQSRVRNVDENVFSFEDGRWVVRFEGKTIYPQDITGIKYLHCLISNAGQSFSPQELYKGFGGRKGSKKPNSLSVGEALNNGVQFTAAQPDVLVDEQGKTEMLARLEQIEVEMANAKLVPDADLIEKLATERIAITAELRKAFTPVGSRRIQEPDLVRRMKAVDIAIRRAKEKIFDSGHAALLAHLNETVEIKVRSGCRYSTPEQVVWRTNANAPQPSL